MSQKIRVAAVEEIPPGTAKEVLAGERILALYHVDGEFYALDGICPHAGGPLGQGILQGQIVTCPWHGWQFDVTDGRHCLNSRLHQQTFPVTVDGGEVFVELG